MKRTRKKKKMRTTRLEARFPYYNLKAMTRSPSPFAWRPDFLEIGRAHV